MGLWPELRMHPQAPRNTRLEPLGVPLAVQAL